MVVSEKSYKKLGDFLNSSIKVKHRFTSLESFHEFANQLEIAEFYEENSDKLLLFLFECYLLMISKGWVIRERVTIGDIDELRTLKFSFGEQIEIPNVDTNAEESGNEKLIDKLIAQSKRIGPTNSENQGKWMNSLRKEKNVDLFLKFPLIFTQLLQFVSIGRILSSPLAPFLVGMIWRLLHVNNLPILRVEGLKMLLNLLKAVSHDPTHKITLECTEIFGSLVDVSSFGCENDELEAHLDKHVLLCEGSALISADLSEFEGPVGGVDLEMLNEIFSFITWDLNPDLHSTRFLYNLLRDQFLSKLFPLAYNKSELNAKTFDENVSGTVIELVVDYLALWFLKSGPRTFRFGSSLLSSSESVNKSKFGDSMVSLVVNDLSNFFGSSSSKKPSIQAYCEIRKDHKNEFPIASFLLEEVLLSSETDVIFIHSILKTACYTLSYISHIFSIKLALEIFRSWLFNPLARRPQFLQDDDKLDNFIYFYLDTLEGLFPHKHLGVRDSQSYDDLQISLVDRVDIYRETVYFFRAVALQAFFSLSFERWIQLIEIEITITDLLLSPENLLERPFFTTEDALLAETLLGSLLRSCEHFEKTEMLEKWKKVSAVLSKCSGCRGVIEEWCRVIEALAILSVKDVKFAKRNGHGVNIPISPSISLLSNSNSMRSSPALSPSASAISGVSGISSSGSLPQTTSSFSAWPDLPTVKSQAVCLFRNMLRILGDPAGTLTELRKSRPDLMTLLFEAMERCLDIFIKCRLEQVVKVPMHNVPPIGDFLPAALSALLHLKSYNSIISVKTDTNSDPQVAHDSSRIVAWKIVGVVMFRPMDLVIPDHYWAALLAAARDALNEPMSAAEFTALIMHVGLPISTAMTPGTTLILTEIVYGMLRFFNDKLWSGNSALAFSAREANVVIPVSMKIITNCLKLAKLFPSAFGHFCDETCVPRLIKIFVSCISDSQLLTIIHTALADVYISECVSVCDENPLLDCHWILEIMLEGPFKFARGMPHVHVVVCLSEYLSSLAYLKVSDPSNSRIDGHYVIDRLFEAIEAGFNVEEYSSALVRIIHGPLSDWIIYAMQVNLTDDLKQKICRLLDLKFVSNAVRLVADQFSMKMLTFGRAFPLQLGSNFVGSEGFDIKENLEPLIFLALTPSHTLLSFFSGADDVIYLTIRNSIGKFTWKMKDIWSIEESCDAFKSENIEFEYESVVEDSEFKFKKVSEVDYLKELLSELKIEHPETLQRPILDENVSDENWTSQCTFEREFVSNFEECEAVTSIYERKRPQMTTSRFSIQLRLLLSSLSFTSSELYSSQFGFGVEVLKTKSLTDGPSLVEEFIALDGISGRFKIKIGVIYMKTGVTDEIDLFSTDNNSSDGLRQEYFDFLDCLMGTADENKNKFETSLIEFEIDEFESLKREGKEDLEVKRRLGNDSVLVLWHEGDSGDSLVERSPLKSEQTAAIIRIRSHGLIPGWYIVTLQTCYERLMQPRKYARLRFDPFTLPGIDESLDLEVDGVYNSGSNVNISGEVQRSGILVESGSLGLIVRALSCAAYRQAHLINCIRSNTSMTASSTHSTQTTLNLSASNRVKYSPDSVRRDRIDEIVQRFGMKDLSYENYISTLYH